MEIALKIEENGVDFYSTQAEKMTGDVQELFETLAQEEENHVEDFKKLKDEVKSDYFNYEDEMASQYIQALADARVFADNELTQLIKSTESPDKIINYAIMLEKESIVFYYGLLDMARGKTEEILNEIIRQEKEHVRKLSAL